MNPPLRRDALLLFVLALALRGYGLAAPLLDYHSWRQADTAAIARNFASGGYQLLYPQVDWGGQTSGYVESEFPLYTFSLALLSGAGVQAWPGRLLSALASAAAVVALYYLVAAVDGRTTARFAALALALMPFSIYFGRTVMPDALMLLAAVLALWCYLRWLAQPGWRHYALALLCLALAPLAKTPNLLILAVPLAYLALAMRLPPRRWPALLGLAVGFGLPVLLWTLHARTLPPDPRLSFGIGEKLFDTRLLLDPAFYLLLGRWGVEHVLTWAGLPMFILGLLSSKVATVVAEHTAGSDNTLLSAVPALANLYVLPLAWLLGVLLFLLIGAAGVVGQDYYILPLAAPAAWLIGRGLTRLLGWLPARRGLVQAVLALWVVALAALSFWRIAPLYQTTDFYQTLGQRANLALPPGARLGVIAPAVSEILYYAGRKGWRLDPGVIVPGGLASLGPDLGVRYLLIADPWLTERRDTLELAVREFRRVPVGPYALLLDLANPGLSGAAYLAWPTGHLVEEPFLSAWQAQGGVDGPGLPISDALDRPEGRLQYFERAVLRQNGQRVEELPGIRDGRARLAADGLTEERMIELTR